MTDQSNNREDLSNQAMLDPFNQALLDDAKRFDTYALERAHSVEKRSLIVTLGMLGVTAIAVVVAVVQAMNTREVQPYVLMVDEKTGQVKELVKVEPQQWTQGVALDAGYLGQYVRSREEYSDAQVAYNYEQVELMSAAPVMDEYMRWIDPEANKLSPMALYPNGVVTIDITAVVRMNQGAAQVHFTRSVKGVPNPPRSSTYIATVEFEYLTKNMTLDARLRNPLGFTVRSYSKDEAVVSSTTQSGQPVRSAAQ